MDCILCADIGTTSLKIGIISESGEVVSVCAQFFTSEDSSFIARSWEKEFVSGAKKLLDELPGELKSSLKIAAVSISGNGPTIVSEDGTTLLWNEPGCPELQTTSLFIPRLLGFKQKFSEVFSASNIIFTGHEYLVWRLTGKALSVLPETRFEKAYWTDQMLRDAGFSEDEIKKLPETCELGENAGNLSVEYLKALGFSEEEKIPVFAAGPDFVMALIGTNTLVSGKICDRCGSSEGINYCSDRQVFAEGIRTLPSVISGLWNLSVIIPESGSKIARFRKEINELSGRENTFEEIVDYSFGDKNSEGYREILKLNQKVHSAVELLKNLSKENSLPFDDKMTVTGGQAKNERWLREKSYEAGIDLAVCNSTDAELTGNAVLALYKLGRFSSIQEAAEQIVKIKKRFSLNDRKQNKLKIYKIPENIKTIIFDIDSTLYTSEAYAIEQVDVQIRCIAKKRGMTNRDARNMISEFRRNWSKANDGKKISLGNALTHFGVEIEESIQMRRDLLEPKNFLGRDEKLIGALEELKKKYKLICVTNNPVLPARKTLEAIGVSEIIPEIIGLDTCGKSKPAREPFELAAKKTGALLEECLAIGDRYDMDISLPLEMGMGGILVTGVEDVWSLPQLLTSQS